MRQVVITYTQANPTAFTAVSAIPAGSVTALSLLNWNCVVNPGLARKISITTVGAFTGTFTITGQDIFGGAISNTITGISSTTTLTTNPFYMLSSVTYTGTVPANGTVSIGTGGNSTAGETCATRWQMLDNNCSRFQFAATVNILTGGMTYRMYCTLDDLDKNSLSTANPPFTLDLISKTETFADYTDIKYFGFPSGSGPGGEGAAVISGIQLTASGIASGSSFVLTYIQQGD